MIADIAALLDIAVWVVIVATAVLYSAAGVGVVLLVWLVCRAIARANQTLWHIGPHDVGPDALLLLEDLDHHLDEYFSNLSPLFEELGPPPPWLVAGEPEPDHRLDRLREAVRDEQKGETP